MRREELHKLLNMVINIGSSSKYRVNFEVHIDNKVGMYADIFIHEIDKNGFPTGNTEHITITNLDELGARLTAWKGIIEKERAEDEADKL